MNMSIVEEFKLFAKTEDVDIFTLNTDVTTDRQLTRETACLVRERIKEAKQVKNRSNAILMIQTNGGVPAAAYMIAREFQEKYEKFSIIVKRCKSAGTLLAIGAHCIYFDDDGELGPIDTQISSNSGFDYVSGLTSIETMKLLQQNVIETFTTSLSRTKEMSLSPELAVEAACRLADSVVKPLASQINPGLMADHQRYLFITAHYGNRLNKKYSNLQDGGLSFLLQSYPDHGFYIDLREAQLLFHRASEIPKELINFLPILYYMLEQNTCSCLTIKDEPANDQTAQDTRTATDETEFNGSGQPAQTSGTASSGSNTSAVTPFNQSRPKPKQRKSGKS